MDRFAPTYRNNRGFTLVELAVVVAVVALLLGTLLVPLASQVEQRNITQTQKQLEEIKEALLGFAMVNGRLPRPATSDTDGKERDTACGNAQDCTGLLPWVALGLPKADAWGKIYAYSVVPEYANAGFDFNTGGTLKTVQTRSPTGSLQNLATNQVAVVISFGASNWGRTENGTDVADMSATNVDEDSNYTKFHCATAGDCTNFISRPAARNAAAAGGEFDDLLAWVPHTILMTRMVVAGKLP
jgi:prepilin-type N-terminal cleavage/methylation domain-containing protein